VARLRGGYGYRRVAAEYCQPIGLTQDQVSLPFRAWTPDNSSRVCDPVTPGS
jgi:hypothetical protein